MRNAKKEAGIILGSILLFFAAFLFMPLAKLLFTSLKTGGGMGVANYVQVIKNNNILHSMINSIRVSLAGAVITTILAFAVAYSANCTNLSSRMKRAIRVGIMIPMLLPTITYGFAIIYSFGKQGFLTKLAGRELVQIYGFNGLLIGYVIYTLPMAFLIIDNSFGYIDKKFIIVSKLMGDGFFRSFTNTVLRPLVGAIGGAFVLSFVLSFTDFGIPASVGGNYNVVATHLYQTMLGSIPDFASGSVIAVMMLFPAGFGVVLLNYLERFNFHYDNPSGSELPQNRARDFSMLMISSGLIACIVAVFAVMLVTPFVRNYPYDMTFSLELFKTTLFSRSVVEVYENSILVAALSAAFGTLLAYGAAIINARTNMDYRFKLSIDSISMITNTVPGMVLGLSYLFLFNRSGLKGTFMIIIVCNAVHLFTTPYLMAKNALSKMNPSWEVTGELMGDTWIRTVMRVIVPNSFSTIVEMAAYLFVNSMITISAVIFLVTARTSVMTSKIKELQHYANFNEIFVLSILILVTNIAVKGAGSAVEKRLSIRD